MRTASIRDHTARRSDRARRTGARRSGVGDRSERLPPSGQPHRPVRAGWADERAGLTGRKIIVDTYGGMAPRRRCVLRQGPVKVDRSAAYTMRWVAKNIVAAELAGGSRCKSPTRSVRPPGGFSSRRSAPRRWLCVLQQAVVDVFDLRPGAIIRDLDLKRPIYAPTAAYGRRPYRHRSSVGAHRPVDELRKAAGLDSTPRMS